MLESKVEQTNMYVPEDYNDYWENIVSEIVQQIYTSAPAFKSAYTGNSTIVMNKVRRRMGKVIPIDLKETLNAFYVRMIPTFSSDDNNGPERGVA
jgi:hypothetical protein